jgi:hypothetical protein
VITRRELPVLGAIAGALHWLEELLIIVSGPLLTLGLGIALVDLLTGGALLATQPALLYTWATSQAIGVDAQLVGSAALLAAAIHARRPWIAVFYALLILPLSYVAFIASDTFALQQSEGITTAQALTRLGMDGTSWIVQRSALAVALVVLSGLLRYRPPAAEASAADEQERLQRELALEPMRQALRARRVAGLRGTLDAAMGKSSPTIVGGNGLNEKDLHSTPALPDDAPGRPPRGPTLGGTPARADAASATTDARGGIHALPSPKRKTPAKRRGVITGSAEERARRAWSPGMTVSQLAASAGIGRSAASKYMRLLTHEQHEQETEVAL